MQFLITEEAKEREVARDTEFKFNVLANNPDLFLELFGADGQKLDRQQAESTAGFMTPANAEEALELLSKLSV